VFLTFPIFSDIALPFRRMFKISNYHCYMNTSKTSKDYEEAIRAEYEEKKLLLYGGQLSSPSPRTIKELSLLCYDGANPRDRETLARFFENRPGRDLRRDIEEFSLNRLRTLCMFLKGETGSTARNGLELIALLIDFKPRPLHEFLKTESHPPAAASAPAAGDTPSGIIVNSLADHLEIKDKHPDRPGINKSIVLLAAIAAAVVLYLSWQHDCSVLVWHKDHYEKYDCEIAGDSLGIKFTPYNEALLRNMRKVTVDSLTPFFGKDGTPRIWYAKVAPGKLEFFTAPGLHPETGKTLRPITDYMIRKYVYRRADSTPIDHQ
jgi:hypothetical protein